MSMRDSAIWYRCVPSNAVPASHTTLSVRVVAPLAGSKPTRCSPVAAHTHWPSCVTPWMVLAPPNGPYSRTTSAGWRAAMGRCLLDGGVPAMSLLQAVSWVAIGVAVVISKAPEGRYPVHRKGAVRWAVKPL
ncbi:hypothetical protein D3C71_1529910 [compost metagenome]